MPVLWACLWTHPQPPCLASGEKIPFQDVLRLTWASAQRTCPSMDLANPRLIRASPSGAPQNDVLEFPSWRSHNFCPNSQQPPPASVALGTHSKGRCHKWISSSGNEREARLGSSLTPSTALMLHFSIWRTPLCKESWWRKKRIWSQWKAKNKGWPVWPAARASQARGFRKIKVWVMWRRTRRVGINSFLSLHGLWYFYNILCIPEIFFLIYHPNKHPWEMLTGSCPEGRRFKKRLFPGLLNLTGKCVIVSSDCSLSLGKTQQCPERGV